MLPKTYRLAKKKDFELVFKNGEAIKGDFLLIKLLKSQLKNSRFGFIVSKKVSNKAHVRNKIKRQMRAVVLKELVNLKKSEDVIIIALPNIKGKAFLDIKKGMVASFKKVKLM